MLGTARGRFVDTEIGFSIEMLGSERGWPVDTEMDFL
jgi:hypothetical protein